MKRVCINVQGQVQGVGFRPYVYQVATELQLTGLVKNTVHGVTIEIQGKLIDKFLQLFPNELPPLASIDTIKVNELPLQPQETEFMIQQSDSGAGATKVAADVSICCDCLHDLFDPHSAFYRYPFVNCTHCGPRYSIINKMPYDRASTSMVKFSMCASCLHAYEDPLDRRYHAQPVACNNCGPSLSHSIEEIADDILTGKIIALKSLGGYQLICDATNSNAVQLLRANKQRPDKPFALMMLNVKSIKQFLASSETEAKLLNSRQRPIVLLKKINTILPEIIAPGLNSLGVMLPYTPLHYLIFNSLLGQPDGLDWLNQLSAKVLIVTSANASGEPLIKDDWIAEEKLSSFPVIASEAKQSISQAPRNDGRSMADKVVSYNREIVTHIDDSVMQCVDDKTFFIRRARSYVPQAITLPYEIPSTLGLGAYLKNTVCITRGKEAFISQHIGDLSNAKTIRVYRETINHMQKVLNIKPECIAHDCHPDFYSSQIASEFNLPRFAIQHHHAHLAACAAEYGVTEPAIGLALDGFGLGDNHESWGGELFYYNTVKNEHLGSLQALRQPGGDKVIKEPWRMAVSVLFELREFEEIKKRFSTQPQLQNLIEILQKQINSPKTSSCGRLFDAASSLLGLCNKTSYEAQAAMLLESQVTKPEILQGGWEFNNHQLSFLPLFKALLDCDAVTGANLFHGTVAAALVEWVSKATQLKQTKKVLLSGGCFLNKVLSELILNELTQLGFEVFIPGQLPVNDAGISFGQAWLAGNHFTGFVL